MSFISLRENLANKCLIIKNKFKKMNAVEPPLRANSPQRPFFRGGGGGGSPCIDSCLDLSTTATFFCHQGGRCGKVQLQNNKEQDFIF